MLRWGAKGLLALIDQILIAGANFFLSIVLARSLAPADYGAYALVFSVFLLFGNTYQALMLSPSLVLASTIYRKRRAQYYGAMLRFHALACTGVSAILLSFALYCYQASYSTNIVGSFVGLAFGIPFILLFWLVRCILYANLSPGRAALGSTVYCLVLLSGVQALKQLGHLNTMTAFVVTGIASLAMALVLLSRLRPDLSTGADSISLHEVWHESWTFGRWELGTTLTFWVLSNLCYYITSSTLDEQHTGALRALQNVALPLSHAFGSAIRLGIPQAAKLYNSDGVDAASQLVYRLFGGGMLLSALYVGIAALSSPLPMRLLYGNKFSEYSGYLPVLLLTTLFWTGAESFAVGLRAMTYTRGVFIAYLMPALLYLAAGFPLAGRYGFSGVVTGLVSSHALACLSALIVFRRAASARSRTVAMSTAVCPG